MAHPCSMCGSTEFLAVLHSEYHGVPSGGTGKFLVTIQKFWEKGPHRRKAL